MNEVITDNENYIRCNTWLNHAGRQTYVDVMFKGLALGSKRNGNDLYKELMNYKNDFITLKNRNIISVIQFNILFPVSQCTNVDMLEITLIHVIIRTCNIIPKPQGGWNIKCIFVLTIALWLIICSKVRLFIYIQAF